MATDTTLLSDLGTDIAVPKPTESDVENRTLGADLGAQLKAAASRGITVRIEGIEVADADGAPLEHGQTTIRIHMHHELLTPLKTGTPDPKFDPSAATMDEVLQYGLGSAEFAAWAATAAMESLREDVEQGNGVRILRAMAVAVAYELKIPRWLADAYRRCMLRFDRYEVCGLDEAFRNEPLTERSRKKLKRRRELKHMVGNALCKAIDADPDRAIDADLFEDVGSQLGIGKTLCREVYDDAVTRGYQDLVSYRRYVRHVRKHGGPPKS